MAIAAHGLVGVTDSLARTRGRFGVPEVIHTSTSLGY